MSPTTYILFYASTFILGYLLCIPIGPVNLEVFHSAVTKHYGHAFSIALGGALGDAVWAMSAFYGITPFTKNRSVEAIFLLATAILTFVIGVLTIKDARFISRIERKEEQLAQRIKRKRWAAVKGLCMVLMNPLGIASWMICLNFLRKLKIYIPLQTGFVIGFFITVFLGVFCYFSTIIFITNRMKKLFNPVTTHRVIRVLGYLLILFSIYFLFYSGKSFFFPNHTNHNLFPR